MNWGKIFEQHHPKCLWLTKTYCSVFGKQLCSEYLQDLFKNHASFPSSSPRGCCRLVPLLGAEVRFASGQVCLLHPCVCSWIEASSHLLPSKLLTFFSISTRNELFLTIVQGSTSELLPSLGFTTPPHTHTAFYPTPSARINTAYVFGHQASRLRMRGSHAAHRSPAASRSFAAHLV